MTTTPTGMPTTIAGAATYYTRLGLYPIPLPHDSAKPGKRPVIRAWQDLRPTDADVPRLFPGDGAGLNVGILLGEPADGLVDIDLDCREAIAVADALLPPTTWLSGRAGALRSHRWYQVAVPPATVRRCDPICARGDARSVLVELRGTGAQTVVPPSRHIASGESIVWHRRDGDRPPLVDIGDLARAVYRCAAAALLARYWPRKGAKHDGRLALAGGLTRAGWPVEDVETFVFAVASAAGDTDLGDCGGAARTTMARRAKGENYAGWPSLATVLTCGRTLAGEVIDAVRGWLGSQNESKSGYQTKANNTAAQRKPRPLRTYTPFPTHALPQPLRSFVREGAVAIGCDASYVALPVLTVAASLIGNARAIQLKRGWYLNFRSFVEQKYSYSQESGVEKWRGPPILMVR